MTPEKRAAQILNDLTPWALQGDTSAWEQLERHICRHIHAAIAEATRWIPVDEALPPVGQTVLVWRVELPPETPPILAFWTGQKWCNHMMSHAFVVDCWQHWAPPRPQEATNAQTET